MAASFFLRLSDISSSRARGHGPLLQGVVLITGDEHHLAIAHFHRDGTQRFPATRSGDALAMHEFEASPVHGADQQAVFRCQEFPRRPV